MRDRPEVRPTTIGSGRVREALFSSAPQRFLLDQNAQSIGH